jgi:hypothetical protein
VLNTVIGRWLNNQVGKNEDDNAIRNNNKNCEKYKVEKYKPTEHKNMANKLVSLSSQDGATSKGVMCCGLKTRVQS